MHGLRLLGLFTFFTATALSAGQFPQPLDLTVNPNKWLVKDTAPIGSSVAVAKATPVEGSPPIIFGLDTEHCLVHNKNKSLPLTIDSSTGLVTTNETVADRSGEKFCVYVTADNGQLLQKFEALGIIVNTTAYPNGVPPGAERIPDGVPLQIPPSILQSMIWQQPPGLYPGRRPANRPPATPPTSPFTSRTSTSATSATISTTVSSTTTATFTTTSTSLPPATSQPVPAPTLAPAAPSPNMVDIALTIVPIVIICIMFALAGIGTFLFRRRICQSKKNSNKEDMKKSSNGLREDPMVLPHWTGPRATNNRYTAWDTDLGSVPPQEAPSAPEKAVDRWEFPRHRLKVFNILGEGCFGQVWKCEAQDIEGNEGPSIVAVKTLKENAGERERSDLLQELQVMKMLEPHPNVVRLIGCCTEKEPLFVIMEYVSHGKLQSFLRNSRAQRCYDNMHGKSNSLTSRQLTSFCYQVARGMQFLSNNGIIHRDLAARNILVGENFTCKVADFGFARDVISSYIYERKSEGRLPIRWMAPESLYDNIFSVKSDIWSFGVLIWEIVTLGSTPYPGLSAAEVMKRVKDGYRLDKPEHCKRELYNIMYYCWEQNPKERPDFSEVVDLLEQLLLSETDYIELHHFPDHCYYNIVSLSGEKL